MSLFELPFAQHVRKKGKAKGQFTTRGIDWIHSLDEHDKLMGYQNSTFPLAVYSNYGTSLGPEFWDPLPVRVGTRSFGTHFLCALGPTSCEFWREINIQKSHLFCILEGN